jgi:putative addiction module component (TIGR02574 family)
MAAVFDEVLQSVLHLPEDERRQLLDAVLATFPESGDPLDPATLAEIERRSAEYDVGLVKPIPWAEVKEQARRG